MLMESETNAVCSSGLIAIFKYIYIFKKICLPTNIYLIIWDSHQTDLGWELGCGVGVSEPRLAMSSEQVKLSSG